MVTTQSKQAWIVVLTTFPPRNCGIATFSSDLCHAFDELYAPELETRIVAVSSPTETNLIYSEKVIGKISQNTCEDYLAMAQELNELAQTKLVSIQHEFGLYGGQDGDYILNFVAALRKPLVITFHTVLPNPDEHLRRVVQTLAAHAQSIIVMTYASRKILTEDYNIDTEKVGVIPHGIHPLSFEPSSKAKQALHLDPQKTLLSTFGLLSRGKGIEYVLEALPAVVKQHNNIHYIIIGATHPVVLREEGEAYRESLIHKITELGLTSYVSFHNRFLETSELLQYLNATDIYLATPLNPNQAVSGTLSYALGAGRPVIATAFAQAKELITPTVGTLVDFRRPDQITQALLELLDDRPKQLVLGKTAYFITRSMTWPNVAHAYMKVFRKQVATLRRYHKHPPAIKIDHLLKMTDDFGIIQFAKLAEPDPTSGYTLDDNARALIIAIRYYQQKKLDICLQKAHIYLNFIHFVQKKGGGFENYVGQDRRLSDSQNLQENLEDANGRTLYALAVAATSPDIPHVLQEKAKFMYERNYHVADHFSSPRAKAFFIKSLALQIHYQAKPAYIERLRSNCEFLVKLYQQHSSDDWQWFEPMMTYSNALLSEALLIGHTITHDQMYFGIGKKSLDFLIATTFENTIYVPIGQQGWFQKDGKRHKFDQQPEDTASMIEALKTMYDTSHIKSYHRLSKQAFHWFLSENLLGQMIYDQVTGGCYDGLGEHEVNLNEGAESTLSYLSSRLLVD